ncbi:hypothetical protein F6X38_19830 [Aureimonas leprariae]|uniref:Uncharacterized protein n=2 Tax=Plantimonas leprariae TaxID=2615207 RepID=A0A7V7PL97_9HYPH|nr:hypothetical protein F6X38_19830 [Aureimonas leprariae]
MKHLTTKFTRCCAYRLERRFGYDGAVERLQERIDNGSIEERSLLADILQALRTSRTGTGHH